MQYAPASPVGSAPKSPDRLIGAFVPREKVLWTFKAVGPVEAMGKLEGDFLALFQSIEFDTNPERPTWTLPAGWEQREEDPEKRFGRIATILIPTAPNQAPPNPAPVEGDAKGAEGEKIEIAVSRAESNTGVVTKGFLFQNLIRWRKQLQADAEFELGVYSQYVGAVPGAKVPIDTVSVFGVFSQGPMMGGMKGGTPGHGADPAGSKPPAESPERPKLTYVLPEGWTEVPLSSIRRGAFRIGPEDSGAMCTVIPLGPAPGSGTVRQNIDQWRSQVGLAPLTDDETQGAAREIPVGKDKGLLTFQQGPANPKSPEGQSVFGAMIDKTSRVWFVKLIGPTPVVEPERERFEAFLKSLELPSE